MRSEAKTLGVESLSSKVEEIHIAVLNLAASYGVFHGLNDALGEGSIASRKSSHAIGVIQYDLIHVLVIRFCALCEDGARARPDDASIAVLMKALDDQELKGRLIERERRWHHAMLSRSPTHPNAPSNIDILVARWERLRGEEDSMRRVRHLRNKKISHVTDGFEKKHSAVLQELWTLIDQTFDVAESIQGVFFGREHRYRDTVTEHKAEGRALIESLRS